MAAFRAEPFITAAARSLMAQTHDDWELLIGADDDVDYLALLAAAGFPADRARQARTARPASGPSVARNAALALATGDLVGALDADDEFSPDRLALLAPLARAHGAVVDRVAVTRPDGAVIDHAFEPLQGLGRLDAATMLECGVPLHPLARRDLIGAGWPTEVRFSEDSLFNLQVMGRNHGLLVAHGAPLYRYRVHPGSLAHAEGSAAVAEAAYDVLIAGLAGDGFGLPPPLRAEALASYLRKRDLNRRFAREGAASGLTFQEFRAAHQPPRTMAPFRPGGAMAESLPTGAD